MDPAPGFPRRTEARWVEDEDEDADADEDELDWTS